MYQPKRPGPVTAVVFLCFAFGGFGLLIFLCLIGSLGLFGYLLANPLEVPPGQPDPLGFIKKADQIVPNLKYYASAYFVATWLLCLIEVIAGVKLLKMRYFGRKLVLTYAVASILVQLTWLGINLAVVDPHDAELSKAMMDWMQQAMPKPADNAAPAGGAAPKEQAPPAGGAPAAPFNPFALDPAAKAVLGIASLAVNLLYPCIIIFIMMMPSIRRAFAIANGDAPPPDEAEPDVVRPAAKDEPPAVPPDDEYRYQARDE